jgi:hypothetical protein
MAGQRALWVLPFSPRGVRQAPMLRDGILLRCNRETMTCEGNDSTLAVLFRHHTQSANTV